MTASSPVLRCLTYTPVLAGNRDSSDPINRVRLDLGCVCAMHGNDSAKTGRAARNRMVDHRMTLFRCQARAQHRGEVAAAADFDAVQSEPRLQSLKLAGHAPNDAAGGLARLKKRALDHQGLASPVRFEVAPRYQSIAEQQRAHVVTVDALG